jgi:hypothetical protein
MRVHAEESEPRPWWQPLVDLAERPELWAALAVGAAVAAAAYVAGYRDGTTSR